MTDLEIKNDRNAYLQALYTRLKSPSGKGRHLIITHIDSFTGFVELIKTGEYHKDINVNISIYSLDPGLVIVLDNALHRTVRLKNFLQWRGIVIG